MPRLLIKGMNKDRSLLEVQSALPKEEFTKVDGSMRGYRYEWGINHFSFQNQKEAFMEAFDITQLEYDIWDAKFVHRWNPETTEWYEDKQIETFHSMTS